MRPGNMLVRVLDSEPFCQSSSYSHPIKDLFFDDRYLSELISDNLIEPTSEGDIQSELTSEGDIQSEPTSEGDIQSELTSEGAI